MAPRPLIASTTRIAGVLWTICPIVLMSFTTPVEVSLNWTKTALMAGSAARARSMSAGTAFVPHS